MKTPLSVLGFAAVALMQPHMANSATEIWSVDGFMNPESALYDLSLIHI